MVIAPSLTIIVEETDEGFLYTGLTPELRERMIRYLMRSKKLTDYEILDEENVSPALIIFYEDHRVKRGLERMLRRNGYNLQRTRIPQLAT